MNLFSPITIGKITLKNRIFMAPLTRCRSVHENTPNEMMVEYYAQRASAGLIITEASQISPQGIGYPCTPGIHSQAQITGWQKVTEAVHQKEGAIFLQLWHVGRISHPSFLGGELPVAPSAIKPAGEVFTFEGMKPYETPRALRTEEINPLIETYITGAKNAIAAGFDGVEIHAANGYLIDQFLRDGTNHRDDTYGGSIENRCRFLLEIITQMAGEIGADKIGVRLSPSSTFNDMHDSNPQVHFSYLCTQLNTYDLAYVHIIDMLEGDKAHGANSVDLALLRDAYHGTLIINGGYDKSRANQAIEEGRADAVAFGVSFIANPDLPQRLKVDAPLNQADPNTFYTQGEEGYTDYPAMA